MLFKALSADSNPVITEGPKTGSRINDVTAMIDPNVLAQFLNIYKPMEATMQQTKNTPETKLKMASEAAFEVVTGAST